MNKRITNGRVWLVLCIVVMLLGVAAVGTLISSAEQTVVAKIGDVEYTTLQSAIDAAASGETTIVLVSDCAENVTVKQSAGKNIIIDGNGKTFTGTLYVDGNKRSTGAETLLIKNLNFVLSGSYGIAAHTSKNTFPHNVTVDGCTFTDTSDAYTYGIYIRHAYNITVKNTEANGLFDFVYANTSVTGFTAENVQITDCSNGFVFAYGSGIELNNVTTTDTLASVSHFNRTPGATMKLTECDLDSSINFGASGATGSLTIELDHTVATLDVVDNVNKLTVKVDDETSNLKIVTEDVVVNDADGAGMKVVCEEGVALEPNADGSYGMVISHPVAEIGGTQYTDLADALAAAVDGDTITLIADIKLDGSTAFNCGEDNYDTLYYVEGKKITIDFGGYYIDVAPVTHGDATPILSDHIISVFYIDNGTDLTLKGEGGIRSYYDDGAYFGLYCFVYSDRSVLTVESGEYVGAKFYSSMFYGDGEPQQINIKGGDFTVVGADRDRPWLTNVGGKNEGTYAVISGGTFNYNILFNEGTQKDSEIEIADGCELVDNADGTWSVIPVKPPVAELNGNQYTSIQEAVNAAVDGDVITLIGDVTLDGSVAYPDSDNGYSALVLVEGKDITLDLAGHTVTVTPKYNAVPHSAAPGYIISAIHIGADASLTVKGDGCIVGNPAAVDATDDAVNGLYCLIYVQDGATLNVEGGSYDAYVSDSIIYAEADNHTYVKGGSFVLRNWDINKPWITNVKGKNSGNYVVFTGGTFNYDIMVNYGTQKDCENDIADGYALVESGEGIWSVIPDVDPVIKGAQLNLGNTFGIYFNLDPDSIILGVDYVAVVTNAAGETVAEIPSSKWVGGTKVLYSGLAAKQMADEFTVTVISEFGASSEPRTTSIKSYVERGLAGNHFDAETIALLTAMLNYGAATQDAYDYNEDNLANTVVADQPVTDVVLTDDTIFGEHHKQTILSIYTGLSITYYFDKGELPEVTKAYLSYVDNRGGRVMTVLDVQTVSDESVDGSAYYVVLFDGFIPEDATSVFTCQLIDAEGNAVATARDSVLSICAREINFLKGLTPEEAAVYAFDVEYFQSLANYIVAVSEYNK